MWNGSVHAEIDEGGESERGIGCYGCLFVVAEFEEGLLEEISVVLDLARGADAGIGLKAAKALVEAGADAPIWYNLN